MRKLLLVIPALLVAACEPQMPNSASGVGFEDYVDYAARREAELRGQQAQAALPQGAPIVPPANGAPLSALSPAATAPLPAPSTPEEAVGADAMASLGLAEPVAPAPAVAAPAPVVSGAAGPNLAAYALSASHAPGTPVYPRGGMHLVSSEKACAWFVSPDLAQIAFLEAGGPQQDRKNLDPDGDGFACGWDPRPFRAALQ